MKRKAVIALFAASSFVGIAHAGVVDVTWLGGTGSWTDPAKWSGGFVPNNNVSDTFRVVIPSGTVSLASSAPAIKIDVLNVTAGGALSTSKRMDVLTTTTIDGRVSTGDTFSVGDAGTLLGSGTLSVAAWLRSAGTLDIPSTMNVRLSGDFTRIGEAGHAVINRGYMFGGANNFNYVSTIGYGQFTNLGTIEAIGRVAFAGTFTRADLGTLTGSGTFGIVGTLNNANQTLVVDATHRWELVGGLGADGAIQGGTVNIAAGSELLIRLPNSAGFGGALDNVVVNGKIEHRGTEPLDVRDGVLKGNVEVHLNGGALEGPGRLISTSPSLTIPSTAFVHGGGPRWLFGTATGVGSGNGPVTNHGKLRAEFGNGGGEFSIFGTSVFNDGTFEISTLMHISAANDQPTGVTFGDGAVLQIVAPSGTSGLLNIIGTLDLSAVDSLLFLSTPPGPQSQFVPIVKTTGGLTGTFNVVSPGWEVQYTSTQVLARYVPEPSAALSIASVALLLRRRYRPSPHRWASHC